VTLRAKKNNRINTKSFRVLCEHHIKFSHQNSKKNCLALSGLMQNLQDRRISKKFIPRLFGAKKKRICLLQNLQEQTGSKKCSPTLFGSKKKRACIFQNGIRSKIKQTKKLPNFLVLKWNGPKYSKIF